MGPSLGYGGAIVSYEPGGDFVFPETEAPAVPFGSRTFTPPTFLHKKGLD